MNPVLIVILIAGGVMGLLACLCFTFAIFMGACLVAEVTGADHPLK